jgi:hypothetical protein
MFAVAKIQNSESRFFCPSILALGTKKNRGGPLQGDLYSF